LVMLLVSCSAVQVQQAAAVCEVAWPLVKAAIACIQDQ
jgi:hypothetical protein